jgi:hypothetical protein
MNIFSSDAFCEAFRSAYYKDANVRPALFRLGNQVWQLPALDGVKPIIACY